MEDRRGEWGETVAPPFSFKLEIPTMKIKTELNTEL